MKLIAIDIGATWIKAGLVETDPPAVLSVERVPFPPFISEQTTWQREIDPETIVALVFGLLLKLQDSAAKGILICGQQGGFVLTDERGSPCSNFVSWQDSRWMHTREEFTAALDSLTEEERRGLGNEAIDSCPVAMLLAYSRRVHIPLGALCCSLPEFVVRRLSEDEEQVSYNHYSDVSLVAAFGAWSLKSQRWSFDLLQRLRLPRVELPYTAPPRFTVGSRRGLSIYAPLGDHQTALLGAGLEEGELSINVGTGAQVSRINSKLEFGGWQVRPYFGRYLNCLTHRLGGRGLAAGEHDAIDMAEDYREAAMIVGPKCSQIVLSGGVGRTEEMQDAVRNVINGVEVRIAPEHETLLGLAEFGRRFIQRGQ